MKIRKIIKRLLGREDPALEIPTPKPIFYADLYYTKSVGRQEYVINRCLGDTSRRVVRLLGVEPNEDWHSMQYVVAWLNFALEKVEGGVDPFVIQLTNKDSHNQWLGWVWRTCDGACLNLDIVSNGHGEPAPWEPSRFLLRDVRKALDESH